MALLLKLFFDILVAILASVIARWVTRALQIQTRHEQCLAWLARKRVRRKSALTKKELVKYGVVKCGDPTIVSETTKNKIVDLLAERGLVWRGEERDPYFFTALSIDIEGLFLHLSPILEMAVLTELNSLYDKEKIACIVVLPFPRRSKSKMMAAFEMALIGCLGSLEIPIDFLTPAVLRERPLGRALTGTTETEKIVVLQPVGVNDDYLEKSIRYIHDHSVSQIVEILTVIDPSGRPQSARSTDPTERVLIELDLSGP